MASFKRLGDRLTCRLAGSRKLDEARYACSTPSTTLLHSENPNVPSHPDRKCYRVSGLNFLWPRFNLEVAMQTEALDPEGIGGEIVALLPAPTENPTNVSQTDAGLAHETTSCRPLPRQKHKLYDDHHLIPPGSNQDATGTPHHPEILNSDTSTNTASTVEGADDSRVSTGTDSPAPDSKPATDQEQTKGRPSFNRLGQRQRNTLAVIEGIFHLRVCFETLFSPCLFARVTGKDSKRKRTRIAVQANADLVLIRSTEDVDEYSPVHIHIRQPPGDIDNENDVEYNGRPLTDQDRTTAVFKAASYTVYGFMFLLGSYIFFSLRAPPTAMANLKSVLPEFLHLLS